MSETPERIWAFAPDIFDNLSVWQDAPSPAGDTIEYVRADRIEELEAKLAKAVEAERERCAKIADRCRLENGFLSKKVFNEQYRRGLEAAGQAIAAAIRAELTGVQKDE